MNLIQLEYFLAAVEKGSLSAAADFLSLSQPSVSEQIRRLERELGTALFIRTNRRLLLTEAGRRLIPEAHNTLRAAVEAVASVREVSDLKSGTVSFGLFGSAHHYILKELVEDFQALHPGLNLRFGGFNSAYVADGVRDGEFEAGLIMIPIDGSNLKVSQPVSSVRLQYWTADITRSAGPKRIQDLADAPLVLSESRWQTTDPLRRQLLAVSQSAGVEITPKVEVEFQDAAIAIAAQGRVDVIASPAIVKQLGFHEVLYGVDIEPPLWESLSFITRRGSRPSSATSLFFDLAAKRLRSSNS